MNKKRLYIRLAGIFVLILIAFAMSRIGKQHAVYIDNKTITVQGEEFKPRDEVSIQVNKQESFDSYKRERAEAFVVGQKHKIKVSFTDDAWNEVVLEEKFTIPHSQEAVVFSIPAFIAHPDDSTYYLTPFVSPTAN